MKLLKEITLAQEEDKILHESPMNLWEMANLTSKTTGIDGYIIWVSTAEGVKHGPRIKIVKGDKWKNNESATIPLTGMPRIIGDIDISQDDFSKIVQWMRQNMEALLKYWNGEERDTFQFLHSLIPYKQES